MHNGEWLVKDAIREPAEDSRINVDCRKRVEIRIEE